MTVEIVIRQIATVLYDDRRWTALRGAPGQLHLYRVALPFGPLTDYAADLAARTPDLVAAESAVIFEAPLFAGAREALVSGFMQTHHVKNASAGEPGAQPNWFVKGLGGSLEVNGGPLAIAPSALSICEEAEVVAVYVVDDQGEPHYCGYTFGNDITDIATFKADRARLSYAKLGQPAASGWLFLGPPPEDVHGVTTIERDDVVWQNAFHTGTAAMRYDVHSMLDTVLSYPQLLTPGSVHYVFLGADTGTFQAGFTIIDGDRITLEFTSHGITLSNMVARQRVRVPS